MLQRIKCYNVLNVTSNEMLQSTKELSGSKIETFCPCSASRNFFPITSHFQSLHLANALTAGTQCDGIPEGLKIICWTVLCFF